MSKCPIGADVSIEIQTLHANRKRGYNLFSGKLTITGNIARSVRDRKIFRVYDDPEIGKHAVTHYRVLENLTFVTFVECRLETGRTHQIRVHLKHIGHTLFNDTHYGGNKILKGVVFSKYKQFVENCFAMMPRQALHAKTLGFEHPETGESMFFESELPVDFKSVLEKWRKVNETYDLSPDLPMNQKKT